MELRVPVLEFELPWMIDRWAEDAACRDVPLFVVRRTFDGDLGIRARFPHSQILALYERGEAVHVVNGQPATIKAGDVCLLGPGCDQTLLRARRLLLRELHFSPTILDSRTWQALDEIEGFKALRVAPGECRRFDLDLLTHAEFSRDFTELSDQWLLDAGAGSVVLPALFLRLLVRLAGFLAASSSEHRPARRLDARQEMVRVAREMIDRNRGVAMRVDQLAAAAHVSRRHFVHLFTTVTGFTPSGYIRAARIEHAKELLENTSLSLAEIAHSTGFADHSHFSRAFRAATNATPKAYRADQISRSAE
jgi:AraC-like DNA-binding protein